MRHAPWILLVVAGCTIRTGQAPPEAAPTPRQAAAPKAKPTAAPAPKPEAKPVEIEVAAPKPAPKPEKVEVKAAKETKQVKAEVKAHIPISRIGAPIRISLDTVQAHIEERLPKKIEEGWQQVSSANKSPKVEARYTVWRDPVKITFKDSAIHVAIPLRYAADFRAKMKNPLGKNWFWLTKGDTWGTEKAPQKVVATATVKLDVTDGWVLRLKTTVDELKHGAPPTGKVCTSGGIKLCTSKESIAPAVRKRLASKLMARVKKATDKLDRRVADEVDLRRRAAGIWKALWAPIPLEAGPDWQRGDAVRHVVLDPRTLELGDLRAEGRDLVVDVGATAIIRVRAKPKKRRVPTLPSRGRPGPDKGVKIAISNGFIGYAALSDLATKALPGAAFFAGDGKKVKLKSLIVHGPQDVRGKQRLLIEAKLGGAVKGTIFIWGKVTFDPKAQTLRVSKINFTAETRQKLEGRLDAAQHGEFRDYLEQHANQALKHVTREQGFGHTVVKSIDGHKWNRWKLQAKLDRIKVEHLEFGNKGLAFDGLVIGTLDARFAPETTGDKGKKK